MCFGGNLKRKKNGEIGNVMNGIILHNCFDPRSFNIRVNFQYT